MSNDDELKSMVTVSSKSFTSMAAPRALKWRNPALHERCSLADMARLREEFQQTFGGKMLPGDFRTLLRDLLNAEYDDDAFNILFMKINTNRDGAIDWDELVSHLILGYFSNDPENQRGSLELPIMGLPVVMRSQHRHPITKVSFCADVGRDRTAAPLQGSYITVSRDGMINWWTLDMTLVRTAFSSSPQLKVRTTWVTDLVAMPDINVVVTSSTERDLRFYDSAAGNFTLKICITSWDYMVCTMCYHFEQDEAERCLLLCGDAGGHVRLLSFSPVMRGPFRSQPGRATVTLRYKEIKRKLPELRLTEFGRVHDEWVRQVAYYRSLRSFVSCATGARALLLCDLAGANTGNVFVVDKGVACFAFDEEAHVLATGGPDCAVRVWNPFVPAKPSAVLRGHHAGVTALVLQSRGQRIYSFSRDRVIKVWDVQAQTCLQTYIDIPPQVGERTPISAAYNAGTRELVLAAVRIAVVALDERLNPLHTDGYTHSRAVSRILYNPLFKTLVTCGLDSIIICWDPVTGKRNSMVRDAHTRLLHGELVPVEITAACFDPAHQLLLTGARNGTLKVWNFNTGLCLRNMAIEHMCEVTSVFWVEGRILAVGWNRHVTEFPESGSGSGGKAWERRHADDVLAAAARAPLSLVTASYSSELVMWKLETGQPYRRFLCTDPTLRIKLSYSKKEAAGGGAEGGEGGGGGGGRRGGSAFRVPSSRGRSPIDPARAMEKARARREREAAAAAGAGGAGEGGAGGAGQGAPRAEPPPRPLAVHAMIFLETRPCTSTDAALMVSLENGMIQGWSDHPAGGCKGTFQAVHTPGDYAASLATDANNEFLFTGTTVGYVKVWLMTNYLTAEKVHVSMPRLRLEFPFLWRDRVEGRARRAVRDEPRPLLLSSHRAHVRCVTALAYVDEHKLLFSGSSDYSVRVWRLSGEYVRTLGGPPPPPRAPARAPGPPDVYKVVSSTTLKVWQHGSVSRFTPGQTPADAHRDITPQELRARTFGAAAGEPLLGAHFALPRRPERPDAVALDDSLPTIPLYTHLRLANPAAVRRPPTPELVRDTRLRAARGKKAHFDSSAHRPSREARRD